MSLVKLIGNYTRYNHWANQTLVDWLQTLEESILVRETLSSFRTIDRTIQHMVHAQNFWLEVMSEADLSKINDIVRVNDTEAVFEDLISGSQKMISVYCSYSQDELSQLVTSDSMTKCRYDFIVHVINHSAHHRGQIITMSRGFGIREQIPNTDFDTFLLGDGTLQLPVKLQ